MKGADMATEEQIQYLPLDQIFPDPDQPRRFFEKESLDGLIASLKEYGQLMPLRVRLVDGRFIIEDGERRWRAAKPAGLSQLAVIVEERPGTGAGTVQRQLVLNCQREDLTSVEKAQAIRRLMEETGWNASQVSAHLGFSKATVSRLLSLLDLPEPIRGRVESGEIPLSAANALARVEDGERREALASQVASGLLTRDGLVGTLKARHDGNPKDARGASRVICRLASATVTVSAEDALDLEAFISTLEEVLTKARRARTQGIELSTLARMFRDQAGA
jgi:ParB family chromosome partitioning protein